MDLSSDSISFYLQNHKRGRQLLYQTKCFPTIQPLNLSSKRLGNTGLMHGFQKTIWFSHAMIRSDIIQIKQIVIF